VTIAKKVVRDINFLQASPAASYNRVIGERRASHQPIQEAEAFEYMNLLAKYLFSTELYRRHLIFIDESNLITSTSE
jgi:hypothetical protein